MVAVEKPVPASRPSEGGGAVLFRRAVALAGAWLLAAAPAPVWAADKVRESELATYLKRLRYEPVKLRSDEGNQFYADGEIGAGRKYVFLVDTGWADLTTLTPKAGAGLKTLGELGVVLDDKLLGPLTNPAIVLIDKLTLGRAQFVNQPAWVKKVSAESFKLPSGGALGCDFFFRNFCLLDCQEKCLYVRAAEPSKDEAGALAETLRRSGFISVPFGTDSFLTIEAKVNGHPVHFIIDTGSSVTVLDDSRLKPLGLTTVKRPGPGSGTMISDDYTGGMMGLGDVGTQKLRVTTIKDFQIGPRRFKDIHLGVTNVKAWGLMKPGTPAEDLEGFLGMEILAGCGALIDCASNTLWFRPEKPGKR